ncbi:hypothetical protein [Candidatus Deianiraea vastatrix]|uniref:Uncharacterized protein n=1 Tax=Candidatus Deianiraea vastatrix TaxID=2163644 RepID=A0A5B8XJS7_9RICK|nr:hypothetical protein [Candidatus Deianiraea vastatrix]QED23787.1 hypothetical protein Deia_01003 [Candidatus Deianiraea vastatrix]
MPNEREKKRKKREYNKKYYNNNKHLVKKSITNERREKCKEYVAKYNEKKRSQNKKKFLAKKAQYQALYRLRKKNLYLQNQIYSSPMNEVNSEISNKSCPEISSENFLNRKSKKINKHDIDYIWQ